VFDFNMLFNYVSDYENDYVLLQTLNCFYKHLKKFWKKQDNSTSFSYDFLTYLNLSFG